jgi:hypothetical protein
VSGTTIKISQAVTFGDLSFVMRFGVGEMRLFKIHYDLKLEIIIRSIC